MTAKEEFKAMVKILEEQRIEIETLTSVVDALQNQIERMKDGQTKTT